MQIDKQQTLKPLTEMQERILTYIRARIHEEGMPPTHDEIRSEFGLRSANGVRQHLRLIQDKGYIDLCPGKSRGIRLRSAVTEDQHQATTEIPILGRIAAGLPILAEERQEGRVTVSETMFPRGNLFALWVHGESMVKVGITDGDLAVIRQQATVEDGEIAAVQIGEEATLKRVYAEKNHVRLKAENDTFSDMLVANNSGADVRVLGLYVGLIRPARLRQCKVRS